MSEQSPQTSSLANALFYKEERVAIFIDGSNFYAAARSLDLYTDFSKLYDLFRESCHLVKALYYTALFEEDGITKMQPIVDYLNYNNFVVITKEARSITRDDGSSRIKGDMDVDITVSVIRQLASVDHFILFTGDGDFCALVQFLQEQGKRVSIVSTIKGNQRILSDELRKQVDHFVELETLVEAIKMERREPR